MGTSSTKVQVIQKKNDLTLVQWYDGDIPVRAWISPDMIISEAGQEMIVENPQAGIPYGVEWRHMVTLQTTSRELERQLRLAGIWTVADLREYPQRVQSALQAAYGVDAVALQRAARNL